MKLYKIVLSFALVVSGSFVGAMDRSGSDLYPRYFERPDGRITLDLRPYNQFGVPCDTPAVGEYYPSKPKNEKNDDLRSIAAQSNVYVNPLNQKNVIEAFCGWMYGNNVQAVTTSQALDNDSVTVFERWDGRLILDNRPYNQFDVPCDTPAVGECYPKRSQKMLTIETFANDVSEGTDDSPTSTATKFSPEKIKTRKNVSIQVSTLDPLCNTRIPFYVPKSALKKNNQ